MLKDTNWKEYVFVGFRLKPEKNNYNTNHGLKTVAIIKNNTFIIQFITYNGTQSKTNGRSSKSKIK